MASTARPRSSPGWTVTTPPRETERMLTAPSRAAQALRIIGSHHPDAHLLCAPCEVTWSGPPASCWSCGRPATAAYTHLAALRTLLRATRPAPAHSQGDR
ncbi:hypothetical protein AB0C81_26750 [Streptomyces roseoverticillatus]|uniref:hypothetical protein n=1 Tax=Streptomyces roseoverticillatus TaxID=66429 RepID=UPI0033F5319B